MKHHSLLHFCRFLLLLLALFGFGATGHAAPLTVTKLADTNDGVCDADCSLREALAVANSDGVASTITFAASVSGTILLSGGTLSIDQPLDIVGPLTPLTISGNDQFAVFYVSGVQASISNLTVSHGNTFSSGGGIFVASYGTLTLFNCTISDNTATGGGISLGGGIANGGTLTLINCTLFGNSAAGSKGRGGGIYNGFGRRLTLTNCTVSGNEATGGNGSRGGGIYSEANGSLNITNSIVAGNATPADLATANIAGMLSTDLNNIIGVTAAEAGLETDSNGKAILKDNGGSTRTIALLPGSPAVNAANTALAIDQRGIARPQGATDDIGAFELESLPSLSVNNSRSLLEGNPGSPGSVTFDITLTGANTQSVTVNYQTLTGVNNPATPGIDYTTKKGKVTFLPGETNKRVTISFIGDSAVELTETFFFDLLNPTNATIADNHGVGTIVNDDGPSLSINNIATFENAASQTFTVTLSAPSTDTVTVEWTTANNTAKVGSDYVAASGVLSFAPGETGKTITVQIIDDSLAEPTETYKIILSKAAYAFITDGTGIGTIHNDDATPNAFADEPSQ